MNNEMNTAHVLKGAVFISITWRYPSDPDFVLQFIVEYSVGVLTVEFHFGSSAA